ncbi:YbhB/YbcL family Raf kinase inhibitor-like protein [Candidatus Woesearchaeota archaeon]|nr:MAG: YbhB/YbcL family Raf kinase inhibitor-like protein [Candidatus Woesearchaeota archaeon]
MKLTGNFEHGKDIPATHTCDGANTIPPLLISDVPPGTKTLALIMDDPDIPDFVKQKMGIDIFDHWILFNIPPGTKTLGPGNTPGTHGKNSPGKNEYTGPCPPDRKHRYFFKLYALDRSLPLAEGATKKEVISAMNGHILAQAELVGLYERQH